MAASSMHIYMDSSDWLEGIAPADHQAGTGSSSPSAELITCPLRPLPHPMERRLRPQHDQPLKCPRCNSIHTKFCYYNNYCLSQPRYFCKTCRRYWTKGGSLRNVPVGGGCRKNKRTTNTKKPSNTSIATGLQLSFPTGLPLPTAVTAANDLCGLNFTDWKYDMMLTGAYGNALQYTDTEVPVGIGDGAYNHAMSALQFAGTAGSGEYMMALPFDGRTKTDADEVKPDRLLSLEWCGGDASRAVAVPSGSYSSGTGLWTGMLGGSHGH